MHKLLAATALTVGCAKPEPLEIKKEDEKAVKKKTDPTAEPVVPDAAVPFDAGPAPTGYAVVDPLPPPACPGVAAAIVASATLTAAGEIELSLSAPKFPATAYSKPTPPTTTPGPSVLSATSARVVGSSYPPSGALVVRMVPDTGATAVYVYVTATCGKKSERLFAYLDLSKATAGKVPVTLSDHF
jgi:hypothetical protein